MPLLSTGVPDKLAAVPVVFWFRVGISAATRAHRLIVVAVPQVPNTSCEVKLVAEAKVRVPAPVIGEPVTGKISWSTKSNASHSSTTSWSSIAASLI